MSQEVFLFGAGGHAKVVIDALLTQNKTTLKLFDDDPKKHAQSWLNFEVLGGRAELLQLWEASSWQAKLIVSVGDNAIRKILAEAFLESGVKLTSAIHKHTTIAPSVCVGEGSMIMAGVVINPDTQIGHNVIVNTGAVVEHDVQIGDHVHIAPNATICGGVKVSELSLIGAGAIILPGVRIGKNCTVGAGAVVLSDVEDGVTVIGVPATRK